MDPALYNFKVLKIRSMFNYVGDIEIYKMLEDCFFNEDEVILRLITQPNYLPYIQSLLQQRAAMNEVSSSGNNNDSAPNEESIKEIKRCNNENNFHNDLNNNTNNNNNKRISMKKDMNSIIIEPIINSQIIKPLSPPYSIQQDISIKTPPSSSCLSSPSLSSLSLSSSTTSTKKNTETKRKYSKRKSIKSIQTTFPENNNNNKNSLSDDDEINNLAVPTTPIPTSLSPSLETKEKKRRVRSVGRLALDDALKQVQENDGQTQRFEGWSGARLRAYRMIDSNPNSYYYRFNAPGEDQHKGPWTPDEKNLFLNRLKEVGANSQWGIFSMAIPGRVGYQCSNFYRLLIASGEIHDDNYVLDEKGKARYLFDKKSENGEIQKMIRTHTKHGRKNLSTMGDLDDDDDDDDDDQGKKLKTYRKKIKKKRTSWGSDDDDDDYTDKAYKPKRKNNNAKKRYTRSMDS
ncbi:unnamed protein product [Cunninghamella echinulata]